MQASRRKSIATRRKPMPCDTVLPAGYPRALLPVMVVTGLLGVGTAHVTAACAYGGHNIDQKVQYRVRTGLETKIGGLETKIDAMQGGRQTRPHPRLRGPDCVVGLSRGWRWSRLARRPRGLRPRVTTTGHVVSAWAYHVVALNTYVYCVIRTSISKPRDKHSAPCMVRGRWVQ